MTLSAGPRAFLLNPFLHPDIVVRLQDGQELVPDAVTVSSSYEIRGGAGAYTAAAMRRRGFDVAPVDRVGTGLFGDLTVAQAAGLGCTTDWISRYDGDHMFVTSVVESRHLGGTMISCSPPAWRQSAPDLQAAVDGLPAAEVYYVWSWFWTYANPNLAELDVVGMLGRARRRAGLFAVDPNWKPSGDPPATEVTALREVAGSADVLKLNARDAAALVGSAGGGKTVRDLLALGPRVVVLTSGPKGCLVGTSESDTVVRLPAPITSTKDTTGAGDTFGGTLVAHYHQTGDPVGAAAEAIAAAALHVAGTASQADSDVRAAELRDQALKGSEVL